MKVNPGLPKCSKLWLSETFMAYYGADQAKLTTSLFIAQGKDKDIELLNQAIYHRLRELSKRLRCEEDTHQAAVLSSSSDPTTPSAPGFEQSSSHLASSSSTSLSASRLDAAAAAAAHQEELSN